MSILKNLNLLPYHAHCTRLNDNLNTKQGGFAKCFLGTLIPSKQQYALKIVAKSTLAKTRAKQKVRLRVKVRVIVE
jgi:hypothetical protein